MVRQVVYYTLLDMVQDGGRGGVWLGVGVILEVV